MTSFLDLPHASCTSRPQIRVSVIIRCKTVKSGSVENTVERVTREVSDEELAGVRVEGVSDTVPDPTAG